MFLMESLMARKTWVRTGVRIGSTTISADAGRGAFAPTGRVTRKASFIGVYRARSWRRACGDSEYRSVELWEDRTFSEAHGGVRPPLLLAHARQEAKHVLNRGTP